MLVTSGHSHRHRERLIHGVPHVEVGSVKDYPGVWAGYAVHESGCARSCAVCRPATACEWTDKTRRVMFGAWRLFSPGCLTDRCFVHRWLPL